MIVGQRHDIEILADISEVIEDQQIEAIQPGDGRLQRQFARIPTMAATYSNLIPATIPI